ncbi:hypothetical protein LUZ60_013168 [Juncus effusus]|nr:hypothetical protein LUZ60_013168 [Juncus effusus]
MKAAAPPGKRRRGPSMVVLALVVCSLLVPFAFLFGRFPAGYVTDERPQQERNFRNFVHSEGAKEEPEEVIKPNYEKPKETPVPTLPKVTKDKSRKVLPDSTVISNPKSPTKVIPKPKSILPPKPLPPPAVTKKRNKVLFSEETEKACQIEFGSYCLWSIERREEMKDAIIKKLKDQLFVSRAFYPSIAKIKGQEGLTKELKQNIQDHERVLSESIVDADLPTSIFKKIEKMDQTIARARSCKVDCNNVDKKLRQILDLTEDEAHFHRKQSAFMYHLGVYTMPKSLHCLNMRLTVEHFKAAPREMDGLQLEKFGEKRYRHYVVFSKNVLAASVTVNSTVMSSEVTGNMVFHVVTDTQNFYAMKLWFTRHIYKEAAVRVLNYDPIPQNFPQKVPQNLFLSEEFRVSVRDSDNPSKTHMEYLSLFSHSHFMLPELFKNLKRAILLDDDLVVQKDLSFLWSLDLGGKVNGAVRFCGVKLGNLRSYLGSNEFYDGNSCAWMSGINVIDLDKWREFNVTDKYLQLLNQFQSDEPTSVQASALPLSLLVFKDLVYPLDERLTLTGLGYNYEINPDLARQAVSLHYNGNMKPWLELGIPDYKRFWKRFLTRDERFMDDCNVHP